MSCLLICFSLGVGPSSPGPTKNFFLDLPPSLSLISIFLSFSYLLMRWIMWLQNWGKGLLCNDDLLNLMNLLLQYWCYYIILVDKTFCLRWKQLPTFSFSCSRFFLSCSDSLICLFLASSASTMSWISDRSFRFSSTTLCVFCWPSCLIFRISSKSGKKKLLL